MNGDVDGPVPDSRGPAPPKSRPINTQPSSERKFRCGLGASLQHFAAANELTFAAWKQLWADARMSAAFHVEFWESSPTKTQNDPAANAGRARLLHRRARWCVRNRCGRRDADRPCIRTILCVLGAAWRPKHKIDVDPQAWTALLTVNFVVCGAGLRCSRRQREK
ncbi:hypothetical protein GQ600_2964 [Phytophthora cactorum]|nr:hypothetical protein GQ600_2964 [Phytophthora cactorum]